MPTTNIAKAAATAEEKVSAQTPQEKFSIAEKICNTAETIICESKRTGYRKRVIDILKNCLKKIDKNIEFFIQNKDDISVKSLLISILALRQAYDLTLDRGAASVSFSDKFKQYCQEFEENQAQFFPKLVEIYNNCYKNCEPKHYAENKMAVAQFKENLLIELKKAEFKKQQKEKLDQLRPLHREIMNKVWEKRNAVLQDARIAHLESQMTVLQRQVDNLTGLIPSPLLPMPFLPTSLILSKPAFFQSDISDDAIFIRNNIISNMEMWFGDFAQSIFDLLKEISSIQKPDGTFYQAYIVGSTLRNGANWKYGKPSDVDIVSDIPKDFSLTQKGKEILEKYKLTFVASKKNSDVIFTKSLPESNFKSLPRIEIFCNSDLQNLQLNAEGRIFTINSLFMNYERELIDPTGQGVNDLINRKINFIENNSPRVSTGLYVNPDLYEPRNFLFENSNVKVLAKNPNILFKMSIFAHKNKFIFDENVLFYIQSHYRFCRDESGHLQSICLKHFTEDPSGTLNALVSTNTLQFFFNVLGLDTELQKIWDDYHPKNESPGYYNSIAIIFFQGIKNSGIEISNLTETDIGNALDAYFSQSLLTSSFFPHQDYNKILTSVLKIYESLMHIHSSVPPGGAEESTTDSDSIVSDPFDHAECQSPSTLSL